jgi:hypothetical protein
MTENTQYAKIAKENLKLTPKKMEVFLKQASSLRRNLKLRQQQKREKEKCMHSK